MSSSDSEASGSRKPAAKKRRTSLACDVCKKRKIRCDGKVAGGKCSNCNEFEWPCTYDSATKKYPSGYVQALQTKIDKLEALLRELHPDKDFTARVGTTLTRTNWMQKGVLGDSELENPRVFVAGLSKPTSTPFSAASHPAATSQSSDAASSSPHPLFVGNTATPKTDAGNNDHEVVVKLNKLSLLPSRIKQTCLGNYYGRSSSRALIVNALALSQELGSDLDLETASDEFTDLMRPEFWQKQSWETKYDALAMPQYRFPEPDLLVQLVDLYFDKTHVDLPIVHQPSFRRDLRDGLHLSSRDFAAVVLLVCANAARYCDDPRVILPGSVNAHSAGYEWFSQVQFAASVGLSSDASLLQALALGVLYLSGKSEIAAWNICGASIRMAENLGIHRKPAYDTEPSINDELFKRAFWTLILFDRWLSSSLGRPCAIFDDDLDLDFPIDCDDMYLAPTDGSPAFKQPDGRPSYISYFIWTLKLSQIMGSALRTLHASDKTKAHHGFNGPEWEQRAIAFYDSTLNRWLESLPTYLRWDPNCKDPVLYQQAASLMARFHEMQIIIHRPYISPGQSGVLPSLTVCSTAARSCSRMIDVIRLHFPGCAPHLYACAYTSAAVLLNSIGSARRLRSSVNPEDLSAVQACMEYVKSLETRWPCTGRVWDILNAVISWGHVPLDEPYLRGQKRARESVNQNPATNTEQTTKSPAAAWTELPSAYPSDGTQAAQSGNWFDVAGSSRVPTTEASGQEPVDMSWLNPPEPPKWPGGPDFSVSAQPDAGAGVPLSNDGANHWPFSLENDLLSGGVNPSETIHFNSRVYASAGPSHAGHTDAYK
ncbi:hypothetical protein PENSPDRAFT_759962 [Peniophora sp. CONT]|nr:hypothetical protein PENSPDRAFT_759962 [Peniophora sp. CONT]